MMDAGKKTGRIVGILFLTLMIVYTVGALLIDPILNSPNYLLEVADKKNNILIGVILELLNGVAYIGIAVLVYPIFKKFSESLALLYLGLRIVEFAMQLVSDMSPLLLITASQDFIAMDIKDTNSIQALGSVLLAQRFWANQMVFITYSLGAIIFYYLAYHLKLIPRLFSVWGLIGAPLVLLNVIFDSLRIDPGMNLGLIMGLNEIILGFWLIIVGFKSMQNK